jgi:ABC-type multidrug transport system fused ATPase/permease subunit
MPVFRKLVRVIGPGRRFKWVVLVIAGLALTGIEVMGAALIFVLLRLVTDPTGGIDLPLVGNPAMMLPFESQASLTLAVTAFIAVFFLLRAVFLVGQTYLHARVVNNTGADIGTRLVRGYLSMPYALHLERKSAELIRNAFYNVQTVKKSLLAPIVDLFAEIMMVLGLTVVLLIIAPLATLVAVAAFGPMVWFLLRWVKPRMKAYGRGAKEAESEGLELLQQGTTGIRDIRILGAEPQITMRYQRTRRKFARLHTRRSTLSEMPRVLIETSLVLFIAAFFAVVVWFDPSGHGALSVLGLFAYVGMRLKPSVQKIVNSVTVRYDTPLSA